MCEERYGFSQVLLLHSRRVPWLASVGKTASKKCLCCAGALVLL